MSSKRLLRQSSFEEDPAAAWNAFLDVVAVHDPQMLDPSQISAGLAFMYDSEVQNGGHFQYFENHGLGLVSATIEALRVLGAISHAAILSEAGSVASEKDWGLISSPLRYVSEEAELDLTALDDRYHLCSPTLEEYLVRHLSEHPEWYIEFGAA